jgi:hypothetical protein
LPPAVMMPQPNKTSPPAGNQGAGENASGDGISSAILAQPTDIGAAYLVIVVSPYGHPRRRPYLSLHHATQAVQRAHAKGQPAHMVLCQLAPIAGDLGEWPA